MRPGRVQWWALQLQVAVQRTLEDIVDEGRDRLISYEGFAACLMLLGSLYRYIRYNKGRAKEQRARGLFGSVGLSLGMQ